MNTKIISLQEAAIQLNVSVTSIHNWIKEGILETTEEGLLSQKNLDDFKVNYLNKNKLSSRANKQYKDIHDHKTLTKKIMKELESLKSGESISKEYESALSDSYRNKEGIYYTPQYIVEDMMKDVKDVENKTFLDPCCGTGNFIIEAIKKGFSADSVYGYDTDENAIKITRKRIKELCGYETNNIKCADFLEIATSTPQQFDYIFTNPPWGKKINKIDKKKYSLLYNIENSNDTCALFYFSCIKLLKEESKMGMLLPESFFNITSFKEARKSLLNKKIDRLIDYNRAFDGLISKAMAFVISNTTVKGNNTSCEIFNIRRHLRSQQSFLDIPKYIFNFDIDEQSSEIIRKAYAKPHITLKDNAQWGLGVITGNNKKICHNTKSEGYVPIYRGKDIFNNRLVEPSLYIREDLSDCRQHANIDLYKAKEKIIYRFISDKIVCYHDDKQRYILNSANLFILNDDFPLSYRQLTDMLNSEFMNWLYKSIFKTHKVLRSDLEILPIWHEYFRQNKEFSEETLLKYLGL